MKEYRIKLSNITEVSEIVDAVERCGFPVRISYQDTAVDAKSIISLLSLGLANTLNAKLEGSDEKLEALMEKYQVEA